MNSQNINNFFLNFNKIYTSFHKKKNSTCTRFVLLTRVTSYTLIRYKDSSWLFSSFYFAKKREKEKENGTSVISTTSKPNWREKARAILDWNVKNMAETKPLLPAIKLSVNVWIFGVFPWELKGLATSSLCLGLSHGVTLPCSALRPIPIIGRPLKPSAYLQVCHQAHQDGTLYNQLRKQAGKGWKTDGHGVVHPNRSFETVLPHLFLLSPVLYPPYFLFLVPFGFF